MYNMPVIHKMKHRGDPDVSFCLSQASLRDCVEGFRVSCVGEKVCYF